MKAALAFFTLLLPVVLGTPALASIPEDGHSAVILAYHRIGDDANPDSNISTEQFLSHIDEIEDGQYNVMPLPDLMAALKTNASLPPRTIAITFEGAFKSVLANAVPVLLEKKIPFTVFYSSDYADGGNAQYMDWNDLKNLAAYGNVSFGILPSSYDRLAGEPESEIKRQVNKARMRHRDMLGGEAQFFSYPFGEYSTAYKSIIEGSSFTAAFGLQSGAVFGASDFFALPRFTMTDKYGDVERFRTVAQTLPFPVLDVEPQGTELNAEKPAIGFSVPDYLVGSLKSLSCFATGQPQPEIHVLDERVELRLKETISEGRIRVNCTLPGPSNPDDDTPAWRWFGMLLVNQEEIPESMPLPD